MNSESQAIPLQLQASAENKRFPTLPSQQLRAHENEPGFALAAQAIEHWIQTPQLSVSEMAQRLCVSSRHLRRVFSANVSVAPKVFQRALMFYVAEQKLRDEQQLSIETIAWDLQLSTASRLYDLCIDFAGVSPGEMKRIGAGLHFRYAVLQTVFGSAWIVTSERGVTELQFVQSTVELEARIRSFRERWAQAKLSHDPEFCARQAGGIVADLGPDVDLRSQRPNMSVRLFVRGTAFQFQVWQALIALKPGETSHYTEIANNIQRPKAVRAVASAIANNSAAMLIPCHRVLRKNGRISGYRWCPGRKAGLLAVEKALSESP